MESEDARTPQRCFHRAAQMLGPYAGKLRLIDTTTCLVAGYDLDSSSTVYLGNMITCMARPMDSFLELVAPFYFPTPSLIQQLLLHCSHTLLAWLKPFSHRQAGSVECGTRESHSLGIWGPTNPQFYFCFAPVTSFSYHNASLIYVFVSYDQA